jgi:chorismate synthase
MNSLGHLLKLTSYGTSHGPAVGAILDGFPSNVVLNHDFIRYQLNRRRPGQSGITTPREESDDYSITSGLFEDKTTGDPIHLVIQNKSQRPSDYGHLKEVYRPSHGDFVYDQKYGHRDYRGGGRSSARVTAPWVGLGALVQAYIKETYGIEILSWVSSVHEIDSELDEVDRKAIDESIVRCPDRTASHQMEAAIVAARDEGDSLGGIITTKVIGLPVGLGSPLFGKLHADLSKCILSINATKGIEFGGGFSMTRKKGSEVNDAITTESGKPRFGQNYSGGIQAGISNGADLLFRTAFKPTATIKKQQNTLDTDGNEVQLEAFGRHDPCVLPRAVPIVETMTALTICDHILLANATGSLADRS